MIVLNACFYNKYASTYVLVVLIYFLFTKLNLLTTYHMFF